MSKKTHIEKAAKYKSDPDYKNWLRSQELISEPERSSFPAFKKFMIKQRKSSEEYHERIRAPFRQKSEADPPTTSSGDARNKSCA